LESHPQGLGNLPLEDHKSVEQVVDASLLRVTVGDHLLHVFPASLPSQISSSEASNINDVDQTTSTEQKWVSAVNFFTSSMESSFKKVIPFAYDYFNSNQEKKGTPFSPGCASSLSRVISGLRANKAWAFSCKIHSIHTLFSNTIPWSCISIFRLLVISFTRMNSLVISEIDVLSWPYDLHSLIHFLS